jgi:hypothetical protein
MDPAVIGVFIPIIAITLGMGLGAMGMWTQHKQKLARFEVERAQAQAAASAGAAGQNGERIAELEDRVRVLERIVTDRGYDLATQIEALRDDRQAAAVELKLDRQPVAQG